MPPASSSPKGALPEPQYLEQARALMRRALAVAADTPAGDVPVGAVIVDPLGREVARATNRREADADPTAHAEVIAIRAAVQQLGDGWRLEDCTLVVTLEPCAMCAGAAIGARVGRIIFGAYEPKTGACGSVYDIPLDPLTVHHPELIGGVLREECEGLMQGFFRNLRNGG
ncbi:nucleoside deaminase [Corynebacterium sp. TAE3-ERU2]|uniref:nucleoside deaminase n=1 Tax=Corynebacterium sp. TAE3-ERU2 TaxID=2849497 RepID=UPI001C442CE6|nr:nucleoside deaminase [Corynebacterium sp. TAE3-ERU2]MBV7302429.1 nucleoside deaminase [Corynebacterium sp. TAE3-ERU2]